MLKKGITDMVRISDARMSGTAYGTVVLHASPEAAAARQCRAIRTDRSGDYDAVGAAAIEDSPSSNWRYSTFARVR